MSNQESRFAWVEVFESEELDSARAALTKQKGENS